MLCYGIVNFQKISIPFPKEGQGYSEGVGESERGIFLKRRGVPKSFLSWGGCEMGLNKHYCVLPNNGGNQIKEMSIYSVIVSSVVACPCQQNDLSLLGVFRNACEEDLDKVLND